MILMFRKNEKGLFSKMNGKYIIPFKTSKISEGPVLITKIVEKEKLNLVDGINLRTKPINVSIDFIKKLHDKLNLSIETLLNPLKTKNADCYNYVNHYSSINSINLTSLINAIVPKTLYKYLDDSILDSKEVDENNINAICLFHSEYIRNEWDSLKKNN